MEGIYRIPPPANNFRIPLRHCSSPTLLRNKFFLLSFLAYKASCYWFIPLSLNPASPVANSHLYFSEQVYLSNLPNLCTKPSGWNNIKTLKSARPSLLRKQFRKHLLSLRACLLGPHPYSKWLTNISNTMLPLRGPILLAGLISVFFPFIFYIYLYCMCVRTYVSTYLNRTV